MARRFIIDTDTASDDAVALVMALRHTDVTVDAITVVAGNVPLDQAVQNALYTVDLSGSDVPVYRGAAQPLLQPLETAQEVHGDDGMGDIGLPLADRQPADGNAVDELIRRFRDEPGEITLVTLGPLTNVALALRRAPDLAQKIRGCFIMGGQGTGTGNVTPLAEYNFYADPEAAAIVMASSLDKTVIGWDISVASASFDDTEAGEIRAIGTPLADFAVDIQGVLHTYAKSVTELVGFDLPDPIAMAVALRPAIAESSHVFAEVLVGDGPDRGVLAIDWRRLTDHAPNARVVTHVPRDDFLEMLRTALS